MMEEWRIINGKPNYLISSLGKVKSLSITKTLGRNTFVTPERVLTPKMTNSGYWYVDLGRSHREYIHRLLALHFIPNPSNKRFNKTNIYQCCNGKRKTANGFTWRYA